MDKTNSQDEMLQSFFRLIRIAVVIVLCFFVLKGYSIWLKRSDSFDILRIEIEGNELISDKKIMAETQLDPNQKIWEVNLKSVDQTISSNPFIERVQLERCFPNVLKIEIHEKYPIALINFKNRFYCIDEEGMVLPSKSGKLYDLPVISGHCKGDIKAGRKVEGTAVQKGLDFCKKLIREKAELYGEISEIVIGKDNKMILYTRRGGIPVRIGEGGFDWKIRYLEAFIKNKLRNTEIKKIRYIDLRYENQVVVGERA